MSIKAEDLRIGNYVITKNGNIIKIDCVRKYFVDVFFNDKSFQSYSYNILKPIELTEDILLKCGFKGNGFVFTHLKLGSVYLKKYYVEADYLLVKSNGGDAITSLKNLHSLQNFFYCITGEELNVKL